MTIPVNGEFLNVSSIVVEVEDALLDGQNWESYVYVSQFNPAKTVELYAGKVEYQDDLSKTSRDVPDDSYYGEYDQGSTEEVYMIFKLTTKEGKEFFFKKAGTADSYGKVSWDGKFRLAMPKTQTVVVYDFA